MTEAKPAARAGFGLSLKGRALRLLAAREHSRTELERKLKDHEETPGQLAQVLDDLQAKDFISEARVVESVIHRRAGRFGASRIKYELLNKGLGAEAVAEAVNRLKGSELERARDIWRRKFDGPALDATGRAKQMRFLAARGFGGDVIRRVVPQAGGEGDREF
jgi:regulatory protein